MRRATFVLVLVAALAVVGLGAGCCAPLAARQEAAGRLHEALLRAGAAWEVYQAGSVPHPAYGPEERAAVEAAGDAHGEAIAEAVELAAELAAAEGVD